ncbi:hypothetical protein B9Z38_12780 [Limnohabitans sp. MMS-10A-160]|uniref:beta strand repeat-containing protein n=1 Tax=unclassified Limnohabitans TaxID=2626134 RepID=UPI000D3706B4|nr:MULTISPECIES: Ig-like domain-containing protein [unclassified Limnohabitans]PUE15613.1 hypothetical protein B9Z43_14865 [Limnohabitans sp. MMS-10A-192]PUE23527.1 hypothetical protein B9Z38_12780 [Limnohabitans sp. MMS-10A-160]
MAQQFKVLVNAGKDEAAQTLLAEQGAGQRGRPLIIKAKAGAKYQLVEQGKGRGNDLAPDNIKAKRVGKHLHLMFETDTVADVIIEDYYDVMPEGYNGVIGKAENGSYYEYLTEDPTDPGLIPQLKDNVTAVTQALGGAEVSPAGAAIAVAAFPLLGALGLLGGAAAVAAAAKNNDTTTTTTTGKLDATAPNDSGVLGDNITNDATPTLSGTVPAGSTATVTINGQTYPVTVNADGTWKFTQPNNLPDGTYTPVLNVTTNGVTTTTNLTPFTVDTFTRVDIGSAGQVGTLNPISGTAEPGDTIVVKDVNGQVIGTATANSAGNWSFTPSAPLPAGAITATATDAAGNTATGTGNPVNANSSLKTALTIDPIAADNVLLANESGATTYTVTGKVTGAFAAGDVVFLSLNGKTYPAVVSADGTYSTLVSMADLKADPDTKIEGSITPTGGDPATAAQDYTVESGNVATQTALSIDPVTADNIINSAEGTGSIAITGKVTGKFSAGDTVTLTVNNKTFTGQVTADGSYSIAVPAADLKADADTRVDGTVTGTGGTLAKAIQDYGVDANVNPAPPASLKTALTIDPIAADNVLLANESGATTYTVTGKVTGAFAAGDVVFLSLNGKTYPAVVSADGTYSTLVSMADLKADPDTKIEGSITPTGGDPATAAQDYTVESGNVATQTALSIDPVTADNIMGSTESTGNIALTGKVTGKFSAGDVVKLTVAGVTYSGTAAADGSYSIPVPAASLLADSDTQVDGTVTGTGGTVAKAVQDYGVDPNINPNNTSTGALTPTAPNDSGVVGDNTTNDNTPSLSGKVPTGSSATVTINGQTYPVTVNPDGTWSFTQPTNLPDGTYYPVLNVTTGGVTTPTNITPFTIDTTPPTVAVISNASALATGETATITFTLSEKSTDFTADDVAVTGGTLSNFQQSATDPKVYTATFTPSSTGTSATVSVASDKFADAAANRNTDGAEANNTVSFKTNATITGALTAIAPNDSGVVGDNTTNDTTPTLNGKVPSGSTATVTINGQTYPVTVNPDGTWSFTNPTNLPDGTYTPQLNVTTNGVTTTTPITPFTIDTTPPTVIVTSGSSSLASGQTANITFTLSEVVSDFSNGDITVAGGTLSNLVQSATDPKVYTAVFTPTGTSANALATIGVASDKFSDAAANFNKDTLISPAPAGATYEANNSVTLTTNATVSGQLSAASDNSTGTPNDHKTNDATPELTGKVPAGSTATVTINGQTYPVTVAPDGSWTFTQPTNLPDGTYTPVLNVTTNGVTTPTNITPFTIDTTPPTVAITGTTNTLAAGQSTTLTFTLSEASNDLTGGDFVVAGGTLSALQQSAIDPKVYTATFTATPGTTTASTATVSIASDKFADAAGNLNKDGADANNLWTGSITPVPAPQPPASLKTALTIDPITGDNVVTLAESGATTYTVTGKVTGTFAAGDLVTLRLNDKPFYATVLADGTYSTVVPMADIKADSDTKIEGSVTGTAGQYATAAQDYTLETTNAVTQTALAIDPVTADNIIGSSESTGSIAITGRVTGKFSAGDVVKLTVAGVTYSGTAAADGSYSIPVPAASLIADSDTAVDGTVTGTGGTVAKAVQDYGVDPNINPGLVDKTPPTIVVARTNSATTTLDANGKETLVFTLSEASTTFDANDIVVFGGSGTITGFAAVPTSGTASTGYTQYTAVFTPTAGTNGTANIGVASGKFADNAGNLNQDTYLSPAPTGATTEVNNSVSVAYDTRNTNTVDNDKPNIQVSIDKTSLASGQTGTLSFILSEASTDFTLSDITVISGGGTVTNLQAVPGSNGTQYTATYTAGANAGNVLIGVAETTFSDAAGNFNADTYKGSATGTTAVSSTTAETNNWVQLTTTGSVDSAPPTVIVSRTGTGNVGSAGEAIVFTFSEGVATSSFTLSDIDATNGSMSNLVPVESSKTATGVYTQYTATYTPATGSAGTGSIGVAAGKFADTAGNNNLDTYNATADTVTGHIVETNNQVVLPIDATNSVDTTPPKIAISADKTTLAAGQTATITFTLSEASTDFVQSDVTTTGGSLSNWTRVNATTYTATYTATAGGQSTGSVHVDSNAFSDAAVNYNQDGADANNTVDFITNNGTDLTAPKIAISSNQASLTTGQTATITFTVSEATTDFDNTDIAVTGGALGTLTHVGVNAAGEDIYTAVFTPAANSTTPATIAVAAGKFRDASGNQNLDTYNATADNVTGHIVETNNIVTLTVNTSTVASTLNLTSDKATALEAGGAYSATGGATAGTNPTMAAASGVLSNDTGTSPTVTGIQKISDSTASPVTAGTTSGTGTSIVGQYGTLKIGADGSYTYTVNNTDAAVQALRTSANTVTDVFTYTASDASGNKTANLVVTVQGANDAPTVVIAEADKTGTVGIALTPFSVINNFADVDSGANGETATYSAAITGGGTWPSWLTFNPATGLFTGTPPTAGTTSVDVTRTDALGLTATDTFLITVNPAVDTTPPKIAISSNQASLTTGQTATITFTVSEATTDFDNTDIAVTGGALGTLTHVGVNAAGEDIYTAVFTPAANSTTPATIAVAAGKFRDASGNQNLDTYNATADNVSGHLVETNNIVTLSVNTTTVAAALVLANDSASALEAGGTANGTVGNNASGSVLTNDVGATPKVTGVQKITDTTATTVSANTTSSTGTSITGQYGTLVMGADGSYIYTIDNNNATVQSLKGSTNTLTEVFTYTANDGTGAKTANLVVTVQGANDAPVAVADVASATEAGGVANGTPGVNPTGNVLTNDTDVDLGDTKAVSAIMAGIAGTPSPVTAANAAADTTGITGAHGTLKIGTDGSYSYTVNQSDAAVEALLPTSTPLTDTFTYTVKDAAGLTSTQTIVISINGAIDVPAVNNSTATIDIVSATTDSGISSSDFITNDQTLSYAGTVTGWVPGLGDRVMLEFTDPLTGSVTTAFATPNSTGAWTWTDASRNPGTYILKATIVSATGTTAINTAAPVNGTNGGYDIQPVVIDTSVGTPAEINLAVSITTDANNNAFVNTTELGAATTFTSRATFDPTLAKPGMVITLSDGTTSTPITLTAAMVAAGFVEATFAKPAEGATQTVTAKLTDIAGNVGTATVSDSAALDTTAITVAVTRAGSGTVTTSEVITFTLSEASPDFAAANVDVTGGTLSNWTKVDATHYTATFTPTAGSNGTATVGVTFDKFSDTAGNLNKDTYVSSPASGYVNDGNNIQSFAFDTRVSASLALSNDTATAVEAGGTANGTAGTNPAIAATSGVLGNDTGATPTVTGIQKISDTTATAVTAGSTGGTGGTSIAGQYGTLVMGADGSYVYTVNNDNATVQALRTTANTLTDVFTYTAADASGTKTANLVVTVQGANDAPTLVIAEADKTVTAGNALTPFSILGNFADVDSTGNGETATYTTSALPSGVTFDAATGTFSGTPTTAGTTGITVTRTDAAGLTATDTFDIIVNPVVDATPPTIAINSNQASLTTGQTATITFTVSEATSDFAWNGSTGDVVVTGGNLSALNHVGVNAAGEDIYTAVFTPATNSTTPATIAVAAGKFHDGANNQNLDTYNASADSVSGHVVETNNIVTLSVNTAVVTALNLTNDTTTALEASGIVNGTAGTNPTGSVLGNDTGTSPTVTGIQLLSASTATAVNAGTNSTSGTPITGQYGTLKIGADGSYVYTVDNANANVQALRTTSNTLTEVFTYTATDSSGSKTASLAVTIQGANDAPTVVVQEADKTATVGNALTPFSIANNFADVDSTANGETATYTATVGGTALPGWLSFNAATGTFSGTPTAAGTTTVTVTRTDAGGLSVTDTFDIVTTLPVIATTVSFSSMTKDSGTTANADWTTNDASAGRLVSGDISAPLATGEVVKVYANGVLVGNAVVNGTKWEITDLGGYSANWTYTAQVVGAASNTGPMSANRLVTLSAADDATATVSGTGSTEAMTYTSGVLDALAGDDTITASSAGLQAILAAGGMIKGGAGLDTLELAAGTTLNLGTLTTNQTVRSIEQVEVITMQGNNSILSMTANDVLSLGATNTGSSSASNTSTMAPYSFAATTQTAIGSGATAVTPTGTTSSADKVQMVIHGASGDTLNLNKLAVDGVTTAGAQGNTGLEGFWDYKGQVTINSVVYKVYNHSTTQAQVLVDVDVTMNIDPPAALALALSNDIANAIEAGGTVNATAGTNPSGNVLGNDQGASPTVTAVQLISNASATAVTASTTSSTGTTITGQYGTLRMGADGSYSYAVDNANATVQGLRTASNTLSEVFTYTANDGTGPKTANLVVTIQGANDAPTLVVAEPDKTGLLVGTAINSFSVAGNFADVDSTANGETATYTASPLPAGITFNAATGTFSGTPTAAGTTSVTVTRTDAGGLSVSDTFDIVIADVITKTVAFSSMTKDSGTVVVGDNDNWLTSDASAGRLVSGTISAALGTNEVVKVYANGTEIGSARVVGQAWDITDLNGYNASANWTYTAKVVNTSTNSSGVLATQVVTTDFAEAAPVITGVFDSEAAGATTIANNGSTVNPIQQVSGTASANAMVYLYDNTSTNLVGSAMADANGNWEVSGFGVLPKANTFSAKQVDVHGNESSLSNLWNVTTTASGGFNGNFDSGGNTGFATDMTLLTAASSFNYVRQRFGFAVLDKPIAYDLNNNPQTVLATLTQSAATTWNGTDTWSQKTYAPDTSVAFEEYEKGYNTFLSLASGKIYYGSFDSYGGVGQLGVLWGSQVDVVKGQTYQFSFDYWNTAVGQYSPAQTTFIRALIDGQQVMATQNRSTGSVTINYTATSTGQIDLTLGAMGWGSGGDFALDNVSFAATTANNGSLVPGSRPGFTESADGTSAAPIAYNGGPMDALGGNDFLGAAAGANLQSLLATGGSYIDGGAGVDTLVLNAGTTLNLNALTVNQTVQPIQQVEVFKLQGTSTLTLSANDVLSLGGANATTMTGYSFAGSSGKVQLVVDATSTDNLVLTPLTTDAVTTNGMLGNTGLAGTWSAAGTATIGSTTYSVYNHSTTDAQVLVAGGATVTPSANVNATQSVVITKVENTGAGAVYSEEFNGGTSTVSANLLNATSPPTYTSTTAINTAATKITTGAWEITTEDIWNSWQANQSFVPVNELYLRSGATAPTNNTYNNAVDNMLGTDAKLQLGLDANEGGGGNDSRLYNFTSTAGPFTSISMKTFGLNNSAYGSSPTQWAYPQVVFRDADGNVVHRVDFLTLNSTTKLDMLNVTLPPGITATSFEFRTINADRWFIDDLSMTAASNEIVPHLGTTADTTHKISGTYATTLNAGEVIKIYDATGTVYLGDAIVDPATKTWTFESPTPAAVGTHPYVAKIESSGSAVVATSNTYTVKILGAGQLDIASISTDSGTAGDFITNDNTLVYNGTLPQALATGEKVLVQIYAANGTTLLRSNAVSPAAGSTTWTWDDTAAAALADGNYVIKATIVATDGVTAVASYGARGTDTQPMVIDSAPPAQTVTFTSMTKDSGIAGANADWTTADASAGRLISGAVSAPLGANDVLKIYANGVEIGNATVSGTQWTITDPAAYSANWTYTAKVVDVAGGMGPQASQGITLDNTETAAVISSVTESGVATAITDGSGTVASAKVITTVSGTGTAGDVVYVYDNSSTNLIGSATVAAGGAWSITGLTLASGAHTFAAVQRDALGNISPNSNLFKLAAGQVNTAGNMLAAVRLEEEGGWAFSQSNMTNTALNFYPGKAVNSGPGYETFRVFFKDGGMSSVSITFSQLPDLQSSADKTQIRFYDANGDLLGMTQNGFFASLLTINNTSPQVYTFNSGTFLNGQLAARMEISAGVSTAYTISNLGLTPGNTNTLTANTPLGVVGTSGVDAMTYNGGAMSGLGGDDVITAQVSTVQAQLAAGGSINGGSGVDTLKLQAGTTLDLTAITGNQTVKNIQEVEIFQMQGQSTLTMSANDVLSLGATDLAGYSFSSSNTASAGKVQFVVQGTATDKLKLSHLASDALGSNTGTLPGEWQDKGTVTIGGVAYQVFDHSTTKAQVLVGGNTQTAVSSNGVAISSMTLDTGTAGDFITSNGAAGRTVTGTIATALSSGDRVEVYADGVLIGNATVSGTNWTLTDTTAHTANWTYTAKLVTASGTTSATTNVVYDGVEAAPAITGVTDSKGNAVASGALTSGNFLSQTAASDTATSPDFAFYIDHVGPNGLTSDSNLTTGPKTVNPIYGINLAYGQEGGMFDAQNPTGPGSKIEMASKNLMTLTKGQAYTFSFDAHAGAQNIDPTLPTLSYATQIKWVLLDANGVQQADVTPWYSGPGRIERNASAYGEAIRLNSRTDTQAYGDAFVNYQTNFLSDLPTGQYRLALAYEGGGTNVMIDRTYFGVAKNPINSVSGTGTAGSLIQLYDNGTTTVVGSTTVAADGTWTVNGLNLAAGTHSFTAKSTDGAGTVSATSAAFNATVTPVALDLNHDGQIGYSQIKMDLNSDGILDTTAWVGSKDGLLVHDVYGDGSVRSTSQFAFARHAGETDLQGLAAQFDSNHDGVLDAKDAQFGEMAVWQDANQNGVTDAGEVKHLAEMGISSIKLSSDGVARTPATGVTESGHSSAQLANGSDMLVADAAFAYEASQAADLVQANGGVLSFKAADTVVDLSRFVANNASATVTQVDLTGTGDNTLRLSLTDVLQQANANGQALQVKGNAGDTLELFTQGTTPVQTSTTDYAAFDLDRNGSVDLLVDQAVRVSMS